MPRDHSLSSWLNRPEKAAYLFIAPSLLILGAFVLVPLISALVISLTDLNMFFTHSALIGARNYIAALTNPDVLRSFGNTLYFVVLSVPTQIAAGMVLAVILAEDSRFNRFMRSMLFIPVVCSLASISLIWSLLLDPTIGVVPYLFTQLGLPRLTFFKDIYLAMPVLAFLTVWKSFGYTMVIIVAGLTGIPTTYYEAAKMDGASGVRRFFSITLPLLRPTLNFCLITTIIGAMQMFDQAYVTTRGGPLQSTRTVVMYIYDKAFSGGYELGYASAVSVLLFVIIILLSLLGNRLTRQTEDTL